MDDYIAKVHRLRKAVRARVQAEDLTPDQGAMAVSEELAPIAFEDPKVRAALDKLKGRDRVGVMGEGAALLGGAGAGAALAGSAAGMAGATTLLGSTSLASLLGGVRYDHSDWLGGRVCCGSGSRWLRHCKTHTVRQ